MSAPARKGVRHASASARRRVRRPRRRRGTRPRRRVLPISAATRMDDDGGQWVLGCVMQCYCSSSD